MRKIFKLGLLLFAISVSCGFFFSPPVSFVTNTGCSEPRQYLTTVGAGTWTNTTSCTEFTIEVIAGGGGGAAGTNASRGGSGGGGGGYSKITGVTIAGSATVGYSVGSAGVDGSSSGASGTDGGDSWFCDDTANCATSAGTAVVVAAAGGVGLSCYFVETYG